MFEERLEPRQHQRKSSHRINRLCHHRVSRAAEAPVFHGDKSVVLASVSNVHSTELGLSGPFHSMRIRWFGWIVFTSTRANAPYISQSHRTCLPASNLPLPFENQ